MVWPSSFSREANAAFVASWAEASANGWLPADAAIGDSLDSFMMLAVWPRVEMLAAGGYHQLRTGAGGVVRIDIVDMGWCFYQLMIDGTGEQIAVIKAQLVFPQSL